MSVRCSPFLRLAAQVGAALASLGAGAVAHAQCTMLVHDTFRLGLRPHGGSGQLRNTVLGESLSGFWPLIPSNTQWAAPNQSGVPTWIWAATSIDPMEVDPQDPSNGTAFGAGHAAALLPFSPPAGGAPFMFSIDVVLGVGQANPVYVGFTSSGATADNFAAAGALWMSIDGQGNWTAFAGSAPVATGNAGYGQFNSGWMRLDFTYDPGASTVAGHIGVDRFGPVAIAVTRPLAFVGFEAHDGFFNDVNNMVVATGSPLTVSVQGTPGPAPIGGTATLTASSNATAPFAAFWRHNGALLADGPTGSGSTISGATTLTLTISNLSTADAGSYDCAVANECGLTGGAAATLQVGGASCYANCDGSTVQPVLTVNDFICFLGRFAAGDSYANCDQSTTPPVLNVNDFTCFLNRFAVGCP